MRCRDLPWVVWGRLSPRMQSDKARAERDQYLRRLGEVRGLLAEERQKRLVAPLEARRLLGDHQVENPWCGCIDAYLGRGLIDPGCPLDVVYDAADELLGFDCGSPVVVSPDGQETE